MSNWRVAKSLLALRAQVDRAAPHRNKSYDGSIGDAAHQAQGSASDHNPWVHDSSGQPVVTAIDITNDPANGCDVAKIAAAIIASRDHRVKYMIFNGRIVSDYAINGVPAWTWRKRSVLDHTHHLHISVDTSQSSFDAVGAWSISGAAQRPPASPLPSLPTQPRRTPPAQVVELQRAVRVAADGMWGPGTDRAVRVLRYAARGSYPWGVKAAQRAVGVTADGIVGPHTRAAVKAAVVAVQRALRVTADGDWGPKTDAAYSAARSRYLNKF